ncbi:MAG: stage II sporulation protein D [Firmicutes bacterium]|nr:stage II sporulation protein D [Bacillota bacterium]
MVRVVGVVALLCAFAIVGIPSAIAFLIGRQLAVEQPGEILVSMLDQATGELVRMALEDYLVGVVAAEMPAAFEIEALKAQAVAARTYTLKKITANRRDPSPAHPGADVCTDAAHCQAWSSREDLMARWGLAGYIGNIRKIVGAVEATSGLVMTYEGELIDAVYHASCGGATEDAANVWGRPIPYLVSVKCDYERPERTFRETISVTPAELLAALGLQNYTLPATASGVQIPAMTPTARAKTVSVFGLSVPATELRRALGLKSTRMSVSARSGKIEFTTSGYGHGVGLCQYGADGMARQGATFDQILKHYYTGVQIQRISPER